MTKRLFIGGPEEISGHEFDVNEHSRQWTVPLYPEFSFKVGDSPPPIQLHEYRVSHFRSGNNDFSVFFHSSIEIGDEMGGLIKAATKRDLS